MTLWKVSVCLVELATGAAFPGNESLTSHRNESYSCWCLSAKRKAILNVNRSSKKDGAGKGKCEKSFGFNQHFFKCASQSASQWPCVGSHCCTPNFFNKFYIAKCAVLQLQDVCFKPTNAVVRQNKFTLLEKYHGLENECFGLGGSSCGLLFKQMCHVSLAEL